MQVLIVSPHYDDAPLSLGQSMIDGDLAAPHVTVGIVFGRTSWVRWWYPSRRRAPIAEAIRLAEEVHASIRFRYRLRVKRLEEAIMRLGSSHTETFLDPEFDPYAAPELDRVVDVVRRWALDADLVLVPLGMGDHVDHRLAAAAGTILASEGVRVGYYEDRPYTTFSTPEAVRAKAASLDPNLEPRAVSGPISEAKGRRIRYPSQMYDIYVQAFTVELGIAREHVWIRPDDPWPSG